MAPEDGLLDSPRHGTWVLVATILGSAMVFIDGTAVNVALPIIQRDLGATVNELQWIVESYALFLAALLLLGGVLGDRYGRRRVFLWGLGVFTAASVACALAATSLQLIVARGAQGVGAAMLTPGSLSIISASFPSGQRGRAIGTWAAFSGLTAVLGPVLGGWLAETVDWRAIFLINVPIALIVLVACVRVPESRDEEREPGLDVAGATTVTLGLGGVVFALVEGPLRGWQDPLVAASGFLGVILLVVFLQIQRRRRDPMVPLGLFRQRTFATANVVTLFVYAALAGNLFFLPLNLIQVQGYSATAAGAALVPFILVLTLFSRATGALADRVGPRKPMAFGSALTGIGFLLLAVPGIGGSYWTTFFPGILVMGVGMTFVVSPLTTAVMGSVKVRFSGVASGINNAVSRTAGLLAVAALGALAVIVFTTQLSAALDATTLDAGEKEAVMAERGRLAELEPPESLDAQERQAVGRAVDASFVEAFRATSIVAGVLCLLGAVLAWVGVETKDEFQAPS